MNRMIRSKKAQVGPVGAIILFCFFLLNYFTWLSAFLSEAGTNYITVTGATGLEAFF